MDAQGERRAAGWVLAGIGAAALFAGGAYWVAAAPEPDPRPVPSATAQPGPSTTELILRVERELPIVPTNLLHDVVVVAQDRAASWYVAVEQGAEYVVTFTCSGSGTFTIDLQPIDNGGMLEAPVSCFQDPQGFHVRAADSGLQVGVERSGVDSGLGAIGVRIVQQR
jgi:hypothetical protein